MGLDIAVLAFVGVVVLLMVLGCLINLFHGGCTMSAHAWPWTGHTITSVLRCILQVKF